MKLIKHGKPELVSPLLCFRFTANCQRCGAEWELEKGDIELFSGIESDGFSKIESKEVSQFETKCSCEECRIGRLTITATPREMVSLPNPPHQFARPSLMGGFTVRDFEYPPTPPKPKG